MVRAQRNDLMNSMHDVEFEIPCTTCRFVEVILDPMEAAVAEAGA